MASDTSVKEPFTTVWEAAQAAASASSSAGSFSTPGSIWKKGSAALAAPAELPICFSSHAPCPR